MEANATEATRVGIMADKPGTGKSITALALIADSPLIASDYVHRDYVRRDYAYHDYANRKARWSGINLIVAPKHLVHQWDKFARSSLGDMNIFAKSMHVTKKELGDIAKGNYDVVIISGESLRELRTCNLNRFQRVIVDEADTIDIGCTTLPIAAFTWLIASNPAPLLVRTCKSHALRMLMGRIDESDYMRTIVKSTSKFVDASMPPMLVSEVSVTSPFGNTVNVDHAIKALASSNVAAAIEALRCACVGSEEELVETLATNNSTPKDVVLRIVSAQTSCPISMEAFCHKTMTPCNHAFELESIVCSLKNNPTCPICRAHVSAQQLVTLSSSQASKTCETRDKCTILVEHLKDLLCEDHRVIIHTAYDPIELQKKLNDMGVNCGIFRGIEKIFEKNSIVLLHDDFAWSGVDMSAATHIFTLHGMWSDKYAQLIGRAQQVGRKAPLNVVNVRFHNEDTFF